MDAGDVYRRPRLRSSATCGGSGCRSPTTCSGEVFLQVARSLPRFRGDEGEELRRWVFTIARNRVIDDARRRSRRARLVAVGPVREEAPPPDDDPLDPALLLAMGALTPEQREVVALRFIADLSLEDVARITGRTTGAVKAMQARGLAHLARILDPASIAE